MKNLTNSLSCLLWFLRNGVVFRVKLPIKTIVMDIKKLRWRTQVNSVDDLLTSRSISGPHYPRRFMPRSFLHWRTILQYSTWLTDRDLIYDFFWVTDVRETILDFSDFSGSVQFSKFRRIQVQKDCTKHNFERLIWARQCWHCTNVFMGSTNHQVTRDCKTWWRYFRICYWGLAILSLEIEEREKLREVSLRWNEIECLVPMDGEQEVHLARYL